MLAPAIFWTVLIGSALIAVGRHVYHVITRVQISDVVTSAKGIEHGYIIGDDLPWYGVNGHFSGIDVRLPKMFPHMYLDNMKANGRSARFVIDPSQKLGLEGDFNTSFTLYAPDKYQAVALEVMTPDVMQAILDQSERYDVEIYEDHLRVLIARRISKRPDLCQELFAVAQPLIDELDGKLRTWSDAEAARAIDQDLLIYPFRGVRIFGRYVLWRRLSYLVFVLMSLSGGFAAGVLAIAGHALVLGWGILIGSALVFTAFTLFILHGDESVRFRS